MQDSNIHVKLDYQEVVDNKKNLLLLEKELLESIRYLKKYQLLRKREIAVKTSVKNDLALLKKIISSVEEHLPADQAEFKPEKYTKEAPQKELRKAAERITAEKRQSDVEREIDEIRAKLSELNAGEGL